MNDVLDDRLRGLATRVHERAADRPGDVDDVFRRRARDDRRHRRTVVAVTVVALVLAGTAAVTVWRVDRSGSRVDLGGSVPVTAAPPPTSGPVRTDTAEPAPAPVTSAPGSLVTVPAPGPTTPPTSVTVPPRPGAMLFPFATVAEAQAWRTGEGAAGHQPWHLSPEGTATAFAAWLGFTDVDRTYGTVLDGSGAHVTVGFANPEGRAVRVAVIHLVRLVAGDGPWEVVGTDDTLDFSIDTPAYASTVSPPVATGGRITGVDENIRVRAYRLGHEGPVGDTPGVPAGGENTRWSSSVAFAPGAGTVVVVASTGGHLAAVERFVVTGVVSR